MSSSGSAAEPRVAIVGAGLAGLACADALAQGGVRAVVYEKGRGPGGRTASRRADALVFDHGAPALDLEGPDLAARVAGWRADGVLAEHGGRLVAAPAGNALARHLAAAVEVRAGARIAGLRGGPPWTLEVERGGATVDEGPFDVVVLTAPAPQSAALLGAHPFAARLAEVAYAPCCAALVRAPAAPRDVDLLEVPGVGVARRMAALPGRPAGDAWVIHADAAWSRARLEEDPGASAAALAASVPALGPPAEVVGHRWRYARVERGLAVDALVDPGAGLVVAGDLARGAGGSGDAACALRSGLAAAAHVLAARAAARR